MMPLQNVRTTATAVNNVVFMQNRLAHTFTVWQRELALVNLFSVQTQTLLLGRVAKKLPLGDVWEHMQFL